MPIQNPENDDKVVYLPRWLKRKYQARVDVACRLDAGDGAAIAKVLGDIAREIGVVHVTTIAGLEKSSFYRTFNGNTDPRISTIAKLVRAIGLKVQMQ